jgi:diguanylate cyclase (GGDEF)-like protein
MLEISYARLTSVQFYQPLADGTYQTLSTGRITPFMTRPYKNRNFVFPISLPSYSYQVVYFRIQSTDSILVPASLWEPQAFHIHERNDYIGQAWYFGMATAMVLFNLLLFIELRDKVYLQYVLFVIGSAITIAAQNGLAQEFLWPDATLLSNISIFSGVSFTLVTLLLFMRTMLNTRIFIPRIDQWLKILMVIHLLAPIAFVISLQTFAKPAALLNLATAILILGTGIFCAYKRQRSAYFFVAAFTMIVIGGVMTAMRSFGYLPTNIFTINGLQFGSTIEMLLLAFTLADRFNTLRREKTNAQNELLKTQQHLVENLQSSERLLETRVGERTAELRILNAKLESLSTTDGLTGIANRRRFDEVLALEWSRASRMGKPLALAMLDIDFFKKYNDHYGHQAGDECLRRIATILNTTICRTGDLVARYGGEEFAFIAPATDGVSAFNIASKVLDALRSSKIQHEMSEFGFVTASIGVASIIPSTDDLPENLVKNADEALYRAKQQGRNRVLLA